MMESERVGVSRTKAILRQLQCRAQNHLAHAPFSGKIHKQHEEISKEELLTGELSDGSWHGHLGPEHVPKGSLAVYVGQEQRRFVIPMSYLSVPEFKVLMDKSAEEFGYDQEGGLQIACEEKDFEDILARCVMYKNKKNKKKV
ncbi:hypothetical protein SLEP1_g36000 [Rubroshorea leprosula]|uniref:Uncharacterized protein n=1 Tax=Rubroshorea leprosula TaxID=152421 RepID=A0AAV5KQ75_9ROSI|nr:hypothetical protein SLEP1_g36000 [Rubroshorea leprosula]